MPVHDWTRVEAGIFHDFHHSWIEEIKRALNSGLLPEEYYALAEQHAAGFGPDVLTLQGRKEDTSAPDRPGSPAAGLKLKPPKVRWTAEAELDFYRRKQSTVVVRHVSGDRVVAMVEVVSPGNKSSRSALRSFVEKAAQLLSAGVQLLILDLFPPGKRDPQGIHAAIWEEVSGQEAEDTPDKPLILAAYSSGDRLRAFVEAVKVEEALPDMPLYLDGEAYIEAPLETTYQNAFSAVPQRWRKVLNPC